MTSTKWNEARIQEYINDQTQESLTLEYKGARALVKGDDKKKNEFTKDVSAMANSGGGLIIYGIAEYADEKRRHLPEKIEPIDQTVIRREWLDQIITDKIRPRIDGIIIYPVPIGNVPHQVVYVIEIPQSTTAHQAIDKKYYKRFNFTSEAMEDYEIRDVMGRTQHPKIGLTFEIHITNESEGYNFLGQTIEQKTKFTLIATGKNLGRVYAQYVNCFISLPSILLTEDDQKHYADDLIDEDGQEYFEWYTENTVRDVVDVEVKLIPIEKYGPARFDPILPSLTRAWEFEINNIIENSDFNSITIRWEVFADNAPVNTGAVNVEDISIIDERK